MKKIITSIKTDLLPILLAVSLVLATMYLFNPDMIIPIIIVGFLGCSVAFLYLNFIKNKHMLISLLLYLVPLIMVAYSFLKILQVGQYHFGFNFYLFIFTPYEQGVRIPLYSLLIFAYSCFGFSSFVFYFTKVIYRPPVVFMIMLIPCFIYAKKLESMPFWIVIVMTALYICVMIHCKQQSLMKKIKVVMDGSYKKSLGIFILLTVFLAAIIPKPENTPFGKYFDNFGTKAFSSIFRMGNYTESSPIINYNDYLSDNILFYVDASEPLYLKKQTYDIYEETSWTLIEKSSRGFINWEKSVIDNDIGEFYQAVKSNIENGTIPPFLDEKSMNLNIVNEEKSASVIGGNFSTDWVFNANGTYETFGLESYRTHHGDMFVYDPIYLSPTSSYFFRYYPQRSTEDYASFAMNFTKESFDELLFKLSYLELPDEQAQAVSFFSKEYTDAYSYYDETYSLYSSKLRSLAYNITKGLESDYEKAAAIENYFHTNDFEYNLRYAPPIGSEGVEYFVFESKKGVCSSYASAMVVMAREVGLPARYVEGFAVTERGEDGRFIVRERHAHAYPEVYISGMGWTVFEPTVSGDYPEASNFKINLNSRTITILLYFIAAVAIVIFTLTRQFINERAFRTALLFKRNKKTAHLFSHMKSLCAKSHGLVAENITIRQLEELISAEYAIDISALSDDYEKMCYSDEVASAGKFRGHLVLYKKFYKAFKKKKGK